MGSRKNFDYLKETLKLHWESNKERDFFNPTDVVGTKVLLIPRKSKNTDNGKIQFHIKENGKLGETLYTDSSSYPQFNTEVMIYKEGLEYLRPFVSSTTHVEEYVSIKPDTYYVADLEGIEYCHHTPFEVLNPNPDAMFKRYKVNIGGRSYYCQDDMYEMVTFPFESVTRELSVKLSEGDPDLVGTELLICRRPIGTKVEDHHKFPDAQALTKRGDLQSTRPESGSFRDQWINQSRYYSSANYLSQDFVVGKVIGYANRPDPAWTGKFTVFIPGMGTQSFYSHEFTNMFIVDPTKKLFGEHTEQFGLLSPLVQAMRNN